MRQQDSILYKCIIHLAGPGSLFSSIKGDFGESAKARIVPDIDSATGGLR